MEKSTKIKKLYKQIQEKLFILIPEKWEKIYLYASILEQESGLQNGEMFFYYFPKGLLKRNPINGYEIPSRFNIEEERYMHLVDSLYHLLKELREAMLEEYQKAWSNVTISIEGIQFQIEYSYVDLVHSRFSAYDRHIIWQYLYLQMPMEMFNKEERRKIESYLMYSKEEAKQKEIDRETFYYKPAKAKVAYSKKEKIEHNSIPKQALEIEYGNKRKTIKLEEISKPEESFEQKVENARKIAETKLKEYDKGTVYVVKEENKQSFNQILNSYRI